MLILAIVASVLGFLLASAAISFRLGSTAYQWRIVAFRNTTIAAMFAIAIALFALYQAANSG